jgi:hypothetical protein
MGFFFFYDIYIKINIMAKAPSTTKKKDTKKNRKGVHSKTKASKNKKAKNYLKRYKGQGRG